ncbi:histidine kinase [Ktedonospora formicarum]|uniref:Histidine kinase n=1 Tax=Ktedonospora formicarum TaxID=2778364 RepID=A0A8J3IBJ9_9CHLR|nr:histidine kinase [Ktedonospora formicarum]
MQQALSSIQSEFISDYYQAAERVIHLRSHVLRWHGTAIDDIDGDDQADGTLDTFHRLIGDLKRREYRVHLSVSSGRRLMALLATAVASLNFDRHDHIWHLYTPQQVKDVASDGRQMHFPADAGVRLIEVPVPLLGPFYPQTDSFRHAQQERRRQVETLEHSRCARVEQESTPAQRRVLRAYSKGLATQQVAIQLHLSPATVNSHKTALLVLCANAWEIEPTVSLDYHFFYRKFANYFRYAEEEYK